MKIYRETPNLVKNRTNISGTSPEHIDTFHFFAGNTNSTQKNFAATRNTFTPLTVTLSSTIHTERTVALPRQQWLSERATTLRHTYTL